jgi:putative transposase
MLSLAEFDNWCHRLNLSQEAQQTIEVIRSSEPSRRKNVSGFYPS